MDRFASWLLFGDRKQSTVELHLKHIRVANRFEPIETWSEDTVRLFLVSLKDKLLKNKSINRYIDTLRAYGAFINKDFLTTIPYFKEQKSIKATMSGQEIEAFLNLPATREKEIHNAWTMYWSIIAYTGMRTGECAKLTVQDVDFGRGVFVLSDTKTNDYRYVPIPPILSDSLQDYIKNLTGEKLFVTKTGALFSDHSWGHNFKKRIELLGIRRKRLTPYSLRHSFATRMLEQDVNLFKVQKIMGHKNIETTNQYTHLTTEDIKSTIKRDRLAREGLSKSEVIDLLEKHIDEFKLDGRFKKRIEKDGASLTIEIC